METVNVLHLAHRKDRYDNMVKQAEEQGFNIEWQEGILNKKNPKQAILAGHKSIIQKAKDNNLSHCLVAEDDCCFFDKGAFDYFLSKIPNDYSIFMGLIYVGETDANNRVVTSFSGGMTFYSIHHSCYDWFLNIPPNNHCDRYTGDHWEELKLYVCKPFVVYQMGGWSDNLRKNLSYEVYLEGKPTYKNSQ